MERPSIGSNGWPSPPRPARQPVAGASPPAGRATRSRRTSFPSAALRAEHLPRGDGPPRHRSTSAPRPSHHGAHGRDLASAGAPCAPGRPGQVRLGVDGHVRQGVPFPSVSDVGFTGVRRPGRHRPGPVPGGGRVTAQLQRCRRPDDLRHRRADQLADRRWVRAAPGTLVAAAPAVLSPTLLILALSGLLSCWRHPHWRSGNLTQVSERALPPAGAGERWTGCRSHVDNTTASTDGAARLFAAGRAGLAWWLVTAADDRRRRSAGWATARTAATTATDTAPGVRDRSRASGSTRRRSRRSPTTATTRSTRARALPGTDGYADSVDYVAGLLEDAGYQVTLDPVEFTFNFPAVLRQLTPVDGRLRDRRVHRQRLGRRSSGQRHPGRHQPHAATGRRPAAARRRTSPASTAAVPPTSR